MIACVPPGPERMDAEVKGVGSGEATAMRRAHQGILRRQRWLPPAGALSGRDPPQPGVAAPGQRPRGAAHLQCRQSGETPSSPAKGRTLPRERCVPPKAPGSASSPRPWPCSG